MSNSNSMALKRKERDDEGEGEMVSANRVVSNGNGRVASAWHEQGDGIVNPNGIISDAVENVASAWYVLGDGKVNPNNIIWDAADRMASLWQELWEQIGPSHKPLAQIGSTPSHELGQYRGVNISIETSDTFAFESPEEMTRAIKGELGPDAGVYIYSRSCNPTVEVLSRYLAAMEGTEKAYCTSSGMSAITATFMYLCQNRGHVVAAEALYGGTHFLLSKFLPEKCNVTTTFVDITDLEAVNHAIIPGKTSVLYFDSVANPALIVANIPKLSKIAHAKGVQVVVDNTFCPMILTPAKHGADIVLHSLTKYVSGGSDILGGAICGTKKVVDEITNFSRGALMMLGPVMNPKEAFDLLQRMAHMGLRMKKHCNRAMKLAHRMKYQLNIKVLYPGLIDHPDHLLMQKMRNKGYGFGAMLCIDMGTTERAYELMRKLREKKFGFLAISLGYYENLISCPGATASGQKLGKNRGKITPGFMRFSIGYVGTLEQKWKQFKEAYEETNASLKLV